MSQLLKSFSRRKHLDLTSSSKLKRCLGTLDLTALGVGATLGVGTYVLAGAISKYQSGPAVCLSMAIAAFASIFAGLCYAEFGTRVPKAGSAYVYGYVCVGELVAFILGWSMILSYGIGASSVAKSYSGYVDAMVGNKMSEAFRAAIPMDVPFLADYVDWFAFGITFGISIILCLGMKESTKFNTVLTLLNVAVIAFVLVGGAFHASGHNWSIEKRELSQIYENEQLNRTEDYGAACLCGRCREEEEDACLDKPDDFNWCGDGGFSPFGMDGVVSGAATAFYGFVGFDVIATMGEEVINPQRAMPIAIILSLSIIFLAYFGLSAVVTLVLPYFLQNAEAPIPFIFEYVGWDWAAWVVRIGAFMGLTASLLGGIVPLPRVIWAMASDGLLFHFLSYTHPTYQTPFAATLFSGFIFAVMAAVFDLRVLMDFMSIGTLLAYTMVSACVILLRYRQTEEDLVKAKEQNLMVYEASAWKQLFNQTDMKIPTKSSSNVTAWATFLIGVFSFIFCGVIANGRDLMSKGVREGSGVGIVLVILVCSVTVILSLLLITIHRQPQSVTFVAFKVPLVPFIPTLSILLNMYLMVSMDAATWAKFGIWMLLGLVIYVGYGMRHSLARDGAAPATAGRAAHENWNRGVEDEVVTDNTAVQGVKNN